MNNATPAQIKAIRATLISRGIMADKDGIALQFSANRTTHISELTIEEARELLQAYNGKQQVKNNNMHGKVFALAHNLGWVEQRTIVQGGRLSQKNDYTKLYNWIKTYSKHKKDINLHTPQELIDLINQLQNVLTSTYNK
jgi:hypothetical protein